METLMSSEQKDRIMKYVNSFLFTKEVMFVYYGGSIAFNTYKEGKSDLDVNVVCNGLSGYMHTSYNDCDFFIYGHDYFMKKQTLDSDLPLYYKTYVDEVLALDKTLIFLNPRFKKEFEEYKKIDLEHKLKKYLKIFNDYHFEVIERQKDQAVKRLYHVLRMRGILENFDKTKKYTLEVNEPWVSKMLRYKEKWNTPEGYLIYINDILPSLEYLRNYEDQLEGE